MGERRTTRGTVRAAAVLVGVVASLVATATTAGAATPSTPVAPESAIVTVTAATTEALQERARTIVAAMSMRQRAGTVVMGHLPTADPTSLANYMDETPLGGFILMGANVPDSQARLGEVTAALTRDASLPPLIAIDQEGGDVSRLSADDFPSARTLKRSSAAATRSAFAARAALVQRAGIGVNFGIVADVAAQPGDFIYRRALGVSPSTTAQRTAAAVAGERGEVLSTLKHFPGHGAAAGDSHTTIPRTRMSLAAWQRADARPFVAGIEAGAELLMFGHLVYTKVDTSPASMSRRWHDIAREDLGFAGVAITDDLGMLQASGRAGYRDPVKNAVQAIAAGNDMVLAVAFTDSRSAARIVAGIETATEGGAISEARLTDAATRVVALRLEVAAAGRGLLPCADCGSVSG